MNENVEKIDIMKAYMCLFLLALAVSTIEGKKKGKGKGEINTEGQALWLQPAGIGMESIFICFIS